MDEFENMLLLFGDPGDLENYRRLRAMARGQAIKDGRLVSWESPTGQLLWVHNPDKCAGQVCVFHNPSKHGMSTWPVNIRETGLIERMCYHDDQQPVGHPDPDSVAFLGESFGIHGCDGCCH